MKRNTYLLSRSPQRRKPVGGWRWSSTLSTRHAIRLAATLLLTADSCKLSVATAYHIASYRLNSATTPATYKSIARRQYFTHSERIEIRIKKLPGTITHKHTRKHFFIRMELGWRTCDMLVADDTRTLFKWRLNNFGKGGLIKRN